MTRSIIITLLAAFSVSCIDPPQVVVEQEPEEIRPAVALPTAPSVRRLTEAQYRNVIFDVLEIDTAARLEPDLRTGGSASLGTAVLSVSPRGVEFSESASLATDVFLSWKCDLRVWRTIRRTGRRA